MRWNGKGGSAVPATGRRVASSNGRAGSGTPRASGGPSHNSTPTKPPQSARIVTAEMAAGGVGRDRPDLDAIEARANAATPAPWVRERAGMVSHGPFGDEFFVDFRDFDEPDAEFITRAREDIPKLVEECRAGRSITDQRDEAVAIIDALIEDFIGGGIGRVNEAGYYALQQLRRVLGSGDTDA